MHLVRVSSQLLVSALFIAVPTNTENFKFFLTLVQFMSNIHSAEFVNRISTLLWCFMVNAEFIEWYQATISGFYRLAIYLREKYDEEYGGILLNWKSIFDILFDLVNMHRGISRIFHRCSSKAILAP